MRCESVSSLSSRTKAENLSKPMPISSISRLISLSSYIPNKTIITLQFSTLSTAEKLYSHLQKNPSNVEKALASVKIKLDSNCVTEVLQRCRPDQSQLGLRFFIWAVLRSDYRHSSFMYGKVCNLFKINRNPQIIKDLIEAYRAEECGVSVATIKVVLNVCRQARIASEALWVLRKMSEFNLRADTTLYNVVIRLFVDKGDMDVADKLMKEMGLIDLYPDMITNVAMIKGLSDCGRLEDAFRLVKDMKRHGCVPNAVVYSTLLDGVCKFGSMEKALELLGEMERAGGDCSPNTITYTSVIRAFCDKKSIEEAVGILDRMEARCCAPNRVTASTLIKALCDEARTSEVYEIIGRVAALGGVSKDECYSSFVVSLLWIKNYEEAEKLFKEMLAGGMKPDGLACSLILKQICGEGRFHDGFRLYEEIENTKGSTTIDSDIFSVLLYGLCQKGHSSEAAKLVRLMLEKQIRIEAPYFDKIQKLLKISGTKELMLHLTGARVRDL